METTKFQNDVQKEKTFLKTIKNSECKEEVGDLQSELQLMIAAYNEQTNALIRSRFDAEMFEAVILANPSDPKALEGKGKANEALKHRRMLIRIIRSQILDNIKFRNQK